MSLVVTVNPSTFSEEIHTGLTPLFAKLCASVEADDRWIASVAFDGMMKTSSGEKPMPAIDWPPARPLPVYVPTFIVPAPALNAVNQYGVHRPGQPALLLTVTLVPMVKPDGSSDWTRLAASTPPRIGLARSPTIVDVRITAP